MTQYLTDADRDNMCRLVFAERLTELRKYAKAAMTLIEQRRTMDSDRRPVMDSLPSFTFGRRPTDQDHIIKVSARTLTELWDAVDKLSAEFDLEHVSDPYERSPETEAAYELVALLELILPERPKPDTAITTDAALCAPMIIGAPGET